MCSWLYFQDFKTRAETNASWHLSCLKYVKALIPTLLCANAEHCSPLNFIHKMSKPIVGFFGNVKIDNTHQAVCLPESKCLISISVLCLTSKSKSLPSLASTCVFVLIRQGTLDVWTCVLYSLLFKYRQVVWIGNVSPFIQNSSRGPRKVPSKKVLL